MGIYIKVCGLKIKNMGRDNIIMLYQERVIPVIGRMVIKMEKVCLCLVQVINILDNLKRG